MKETKANFYISASLAVAMILMIAAILVFQKPPPMTPPSVHQAGPVLSPKIDQELPLMSPKRAEAVLFGNSIFNQTGRYAKGFVGAQLSCTQCHFGGGQQKGILGLVGVAPQYPAFDPRSGKIINLQERIQSCFLRSENGKAPAQGSSIVKGLSDYLIALSDHWPKGENPPWRNLDRIAPSDQIPIDRLRADLGKQLYERHCAACHGIDGIPLAGMPPLWGAKSFNDGAGLARVYSLAAFIHDAMPLGEANSLSLEEAQEIAAFIDSQDRPVFSGKDQDYQDGRIPVDAVYYTKKYPKNPLRRD